MRGVRRTVREVSQLGQSLFRQESLPTAALDAVRQGRASEARSPAAGGAEASGIEARMSRDREPGSIHESPVLAQPGDAMLSGRSPFGHDDTAQAQHMFT